MTVLCGFIATISLMPFRFKLAAGLASRAQTVDLVPYPLLAALLGPMVTINIHHTVHLLAYGVAMFILLQLMRRAMLSYVLLAVVAAGTELLQHLLYRADFEWDDLGADLLATSGVLAAHFLLRLSSGRQRAVQPQDSLG